MAVRFSGTLSEHVVSAVVKKIVDEGWDAAKQLLTGNQGGQAVPSIPQQMSPSDFYYTFEYGFFSCYFFDPSTSRNVRYRWVCYQQPHGVVCRWEPY